MAGAKIATDDDDHHDGDNSPSCCKGREWKYNYLVGVGMGMRGGVRPYASVGLLLDRIG